MCFLVSDTLFIIQSLVQINIIKYRPPENMLQLSSNSPSLQCEIVRTRKLADELLIFVATVRYALVSRFRKNDSHRCFKSANHYPRYKISLMYNEMNDASTIFKGSPISRDSMYPPMILQKLVWKSTRMSFLSHISWKEVAFKLYSDDLNSVCRQLRKMLNNYSFLKHQI